MPTVVLITNDSTHGRRVLQTLWERGIVLDEVLYLSGRLGLPAAKGGGLAGRVVRWPYSVARTLMRTVHFRRERRARYAMRCARVTEVGGMDGPRLLRRLRELQPDWIIVGGGGILGVDVIRTARMGVLNVHPALLPWARGCGVVGASLEHGVAVGATLHYVDPGIDTGAVIERRLLSVRPDDVHLAALELAATELAAEMMADAVEAVVRHGDVPAAIAQAGRYPLFRWLDAAGQARQRAVAATGRAHQLYEAWRPLCVDPERGILPPHLSSAPPSLTLQPVAPRPATSNPANGQV